MAGCAGGQIVGLDAAKGGAHRAACIRAQLDPHPCYICSRCPSCRRGRGTQSGDQRQDFGEQPAGHRNLCELKRDVSAVADNLCADLDQLFAQAGHRPPLHRLGYCQRAHEVDGVDGPD